MKKILSLALSVILILSMITVPTVFAAEDDGIIYDVNFDGDLSTVLEKAGWTNQTAGTETGASIKTVDAAAEGVPQADSLVSGKVLEIKGTGANSLANIKIPYSGYTYDNDTLHVEYDFYADTIVDDTKTHVVLFTPSVYMMWANGTNLQLWISQGVTNGDPDAPSRKGGAVIVSQPKWYHVEYIIDPVDVKPVELAGSTFTNQYTLRVIVTPLNEGGTVVDTTFITNASSFNYASGVMLKADSSSYNGVTYVDNFKMYTRDKFGIKTAGLSEELSVDSSYVDIEMNRDVDEDSLENASVDKGSASYSLADNKTVRVTFTEDLLYNTTYTVDLSGLKDKDGQAVEYGTGKISFTTENAPLPVTLGDITYKKGFLGSADIEKLDDVKGGTLYYSVPVTGNAEAESSVTVMTGLYRGNDLIVCSFAGKTFGIRETDTVSGTLLIPADITDCTVKTFVCKGLENLTVIGDAAKILE